MKRQGFAIVLLVAAMGCVGCGSSGSGGSSGSMSDAAAALERENAGGGATAGATPSASDGGAPVAVAPSAPVAVDPSLASKRGFDLEDWSNEAAYVLIKADVAKAAESLAGALKGKVIRDVLGKPVDEEKSQAVVYQLAGHPWSVFACDSGQLEELTPVLSRDADVLVFWNSDFNGWAGAELYRGGEEVEAVHWGGVDEKLGEDANGSLWQAEGKVDRQYEDITSTDSYLFRSKLRKATPEELQKGDAFVDDVFVKNDAYLPDADQMPWFDYDTKMIGSPLGAAAFAGVHAVEVSGP